MVTYVRRFKEIYNFRMKYIFHITISHNRKDSRIFHRIVKSISQRDYNVKLIVADGKGNELLKNIEIIDISGKSLLFKSNLLKQIRLFKII